MTGRILKVIVLLAILALIVTAWAAETPQIMEQRRLIEQEQATPKGGMSWHNLPIGDGPQDRTNNWLSTQASSGSIIQDDYVVHTGLNNVTNGPGLQMAATSYDFQDNDANPHKCGTTGSGQYIHFSWMHWDVIPESINRVDRFVQFQTYNSATGLFIHGANGVLISGAGCDPLLARAGYVSLDVDKDNRARLAAHQRDCAEQPTSADYCSWQWRMTSTPNFAVFQEGLLAGSKGVLGNADDDMIWPHLTVDRQSGTDWTYVLSHPYQSNDNVYMWRWNGTLWQGPYLIDSCTGLSYNIAANPTNNDIAFVSEGAFPWPSNPLGINQIYYRKSTTRGDDWGPVSTTGLGDLNRHFITSYSNAAGPGAWLEVVGDYDNAGKLHVVWNEQRVQNASEQGSWKHWDDGVQTITTIHNAFYDNKGQGGGRDIHIAYPTIGFGDGSTTCGTSTNLNYVYMTFVQFGGTDAAAQADMSAKGYMNGEIYLTSSADGGIRWSPAKNLTNTRKPGCDPSVAADSCPSENWPSIARTIDDTIHIQYVDDKDAGDAVFSQGLWTFNPVMYYRIPGGNGVQPVCPLIAPNASAELTDANGPNCEYNTPPNTSISEALKLSNVGNAAMTGIISKTYIAPPSGTWLSVMGLGSYTIPTGGADLSFAVTMNATGLAEGLYRAQISVTHNDPTKVSPFVIPVDFFVFYSFACPEWVTLHTRWLELAVSNIERQTNGPNVGSGSVKGLYRAPRFGSADSGNNSVYDASLVIARLRGVGDTIAYRYIFGDGNYAKGFRALSSLKVDTSKYGTGGGMAWARANQTTVDSVIGVDVKYEFPQNTDSSNFVIIKYKIFNRTASTIPGLYIGEAADFDIVPSKANAKWQSGTQNKSGFNSGMSLIWQQGADSGTTTIAQKYMAGMSSIQAAPSPRAWAAPNDPWLFKSKGGGFSEGYLYSQMVKSGFEIIPFPTGTTTNGVDQHSVITFEKNLDLTATTVKRYTMAFVTSVLGPTDADLVATTKKAWKWAFGWEGDLVKLDTVPASTARTYPYWANGSTEAGPGACFGCVVSKVSGDPLLTFTAGADPCSGTINFAGTATPGTYMATFAVKSVTGAGCPSPQYADNAVVTIVVPNVITCDCPNQGDVTNDGFVDVFDVIQEVEIAFSGGTDFQDPHCKTTRGDVVYDSAVDVFDVIRLVDMAFSGGVADNPCL